MKATAVFSLFILLGLGASQRAHADEIDTLRERLKRDFVAANYSNGGASTYSDSDAGTYLSQLRGNGSWAYVNYGDSSYSWSPGTHLYNLAAMSAAFNRPGTSYYQDPAMRDGILRAYDYWFARRPARSDNWWPNIIGGPMQMAQILLLMEPQLGAARIQQGIAYSAAGQGPAYAGQNIVWIEGIRVVLNVLDATHNMTDLSQAFGAMGSTLGITDGGDYGDGIRQDYSFDQHGSQLYNGGYGAIFVHDLSYWFYWSRGLSFAFSAEQIDRLSQLILEGSQWMIRRGCWDQATQGRLIVVPGHMCNVTGWVVPALDLMSAVNPGRSAEFQAFKSHIQGMNDSALTGNKHFWLADYMTHRRPGYYAGLKMSSTRVLSHEALAGVNLQGIYLDQAAMMIMRDSLEYQDIFPVWDWGRIPGVTSPHKNPAPTPAENQPGSASFAGGVSDGRYGATGFDFSWDGAWGKKSCVFFDDQIACLGTEIGGNSAERIFTSINQSFLRGNVTVSYDSGSGNIVERGARALKSPRWVHHDGTGYVFPVAGPVQLKNDAQRGSWGAINSGLSRASITRDVFSLWFDHGRSPSGQSYAYVLLPNASPSQTQSYANNPTVRVVSNTAAQQAVRNDALGIAGIVFYAPGPVQIRSGLSVSADQRVIVLVDESVSPARVTVAQPENRALTANITLSGDFNTTLAFNLPGGRSAGSSATMTVTEGIPPSPPPPPPTTGRTDALAIAGQTVPATMVPAQNYHISIRGGGPRSSDEGGRQLGWGCATDAEEVAHR